MNNQTEKSDIIRIDLKERCVFISKDVLHFIGDPKYIQFLINRETRMMFIRGHDTKVGSGIAVKPRVYTDAEFRCRMYKSAFAEAIGTFCGWDSQGKYQLYGTSYANRVMRFSFEDAERLDHNAADFQSCR